MTTDHERIEKFVTEISRCFYAPATKQKEPAMAFEQKTNTGALFRDDRKSSETDRDYSGTLNVDGVDYWISGWIKESKKGTKFLSLSVKPKEPKAEDFSSGASPKRDMDDEIPF